MFVRVVTAHPILAALRHARDQTDALGGVGFAVSLPPGETFRHQPPLVIIVPGRAKQQPRDLHAPGTGIGPRQRRHRLVDRRDALLRREEHELVRVVRHHPRAGRLEPVRVALQVVHAGVEHEVLTEPPRLRARRLVDTLAPALRLDVRGQTPDDPRFRVGVEDALRVVVAAVVQDEEGVEPDQEVVLEPLAQVRGLVAAIESRARVRRARRK